MFYKLLLSFFIYFLIIQLGIAQDKWNSDSIKISEKDSFSAIINTRQVEKSYLIQLRISTN